VKKAKPKTTGKSFRELQRPIDVDPTRRARVDDYKRAMREAVALGELRASRDVTQQQLAGTLRTTQPNVSRIEHQDDLYLSTLRSYVEALGGHLELQAVFPDQTLVLDPEAGRSE
jgi:ribosome-binding protein aMBF1 (putative translation factor)